MTHDSEFEVHLLIRTLININTGRYRVPQVVKVELPSATN